MSFFKIKISILFLLVSFSSSLFSYEFVIASMFKNEAPYLKEWVEYHKMAGVDHFWLYDDGSTDNWKEVLLPYMEEGLVEVFNWPEYPSVEFVNVLEKDTSIVRKEVPYVKETAKLLRKGANFWSYYNFIGRQCMAFKESLKKGRGVAKWLAFVDIDEFILPMKESSIPNCLDKHFSDAQAIYVNWRCFGTGGVRIPKGESLLFNLMSCSLQGHPRNSVGKMIIRPDCAQVDEAYWWESIMPYSPHFCFLQEEGAYYNGSGEEVFPLQEGQFKPDGLPHSKYIRINHYTMRDETFFREVRLERLRAVGYEEEAEMNIEHNKNFSVMKDRAMINYLKKNHPQAEAKLRSSS